jgi:hypothetical protein
LVKVSSSIESDETAVKEIYGTMGEGLLVRQSGLTGGSESGRESLQGSEMTLKGGERNIEIP